MLRILGVVMLVAAIGLLWFGRMKLSGTKGVPGNLVFSLYPATCIALFCGALFFLFGLGT